MRAERFFKLASDATRLRILLLLQYEGELCVCELTQALDLSQPKVSRHLALLREAGFVVARRAGQWMHYRISPELPAWVGSVLAETRKGAAGTDMLGPCRRRLAAMPRRPESAACG